MCCMNNIYTALFALSLTVALVVPATAQEDIKGSSDHPLFPKRMPGYYISNYRQQEFASYTFRTRPPTSVEGKHTQINYYLTDPSQHPGGLAIRRNYESAIKSAGGDVVYADEKVSVLKAKRDGADVWAEVRASTGRYVFLNIVECAPMEQVITADAIGTAIDRDGFIPLNIHFATGKAEIKPDSVPIIDEISALLKKRPDLKVGIEGHTDNTGTPGLNKSLSDARAKAVMNAVAARGIAPGRLDAVGHGQERPVADNRTEDGRAKNRRVEIVKR